MTEIKAHKKVDCYIIHFDKPLGSGSYAHVYVCYHQITHIPFAIKIIDRAQCTLVAM